MLTLRLRRIIACLITGVFFAVAALAEVNGASLQDAIVKAAVAAAVLTCLAIAFLHILDDALGRMGETQSGGALLDETHTEVLSELEQLSRDRSKREQ